MRLFGLRAVLCHDLLSRDAPTIVFHLLGEVGAEDLDPDCFLAEDAQV